MFSVLWSSILNLPIGLRVVEPQSSPFARGAYPHKRGLGLMVCRTESGASPLACADSIAQTTRGFSVSSPPCRHPRSSPAVAHASRLATMSVPVYSAVIPTKESKGETKTPPDRASTTPRGGIYLFQMKICTPDQRARLTFEYKDMNKVHILC